jgi:hypothetical protein
MGPEGKKMYLPAIWRVVIVLVICGETRGWIRKPVGKKMYLPEEH